MYAWLTRALCALFLVSAGCSATDPFSGSAYDKALEIPALPYSVTVLDVEMPLEFGSAGGLDDGSFVPPLIADETFVNDITDSIVDALDEFETFASSGRVGENAIPADLEIQLRIATTQPTQVDRIEDTSSVWVNTGLWFLLGLPGWIMDDVRYVQPIEMSYTVTNRSTGATLLESVIDIGDDNVLNFLRRAGWRQFLLQIVVPPFVTDRITPDVDRADSALYENYISLIQRTIGGTLKRKLIAELIGSSRPVVLVEADRRGDLPTAWIFSDSPATSARLSGRRGTSSEIELSVERRAKTKRFRESLRRKDAKRLRDYHHHYRVELPDSGELLKLHVTFEGGQSHSWTFR